MSKRTSLFVDDFGELHVFDTPDYYSDRIYPHGAKFFTDYSTGLRLELIDYWYESSISFEDAKKMAGPDGWPIKDIKNPYGADDRPLIIEYSTVDPESYDDKVVKGVVALGIAIFLAISWYLSK